MCRPCRFLLLLASVAATACDRTPVDRPGVTRADSAGVKLITSSMPDRPLPWRFERIDVLRDSAGQPWLFSMLPRHFVLTDRAGRTYVLTRDPAIVRFGRDGRYERSVGRVGSGPGEFRLPVALGAMSDTLYVVDAAKRGLARFAPDLSPTTDYPLVGALAGAEAFTFRQGGVWFRRTDARDDADVTAVYADTLGAPPLQRVVVPVGATADLGCSTSPRTVPLFAPQIAMATATARILVNAQPAYDLRLYEGPRPIASIRRTTAPRAPTADDVRTLYPQGMRIGMGAGGPSCVVPVETLMARQGVATTYPAVFDVALLSDGTMWALRTPHAVQPAVVDVFGSDGVYTGTTTGLGLPLGLHPNGELLFAQADTASGGWHIQRTKVLRR